MAKDPAIVFGVVVRRCRKSRGLSQLELAEKADLHLNAVSLIERGKRSPNLHSIVALATALEIPLGKLLATVARDLAKS